MSSTFCVAILTALWASKQEESTKMKAVAPATVFRYCDRHSDETCYQTVSKGLEEIVREAKAVLLTLVPEQYRPAAVEAHTHTLLGRPLYIATNVNDDFLWSGRRFNSKIQISIT